MTTPIVTLVGTSNAGKTTFLEKLIVALKSHGLTVGTIKHHGHDFDIDKPGKDTWRHAQAGADAVAISSPEKLAVIRKVQHELALDEVAVQLGPMDIIITEGYKRSNKPKIEISRQAHSSTLLSRPEELLAVVSDTTWDIGVPVYTLDDAAGVAHLLITTFNLHPADPKV